MHLSRPPAGERQPDLCGAVMGIDYSLLAFPKKGAPKPVAKPAVPAKVAPAKKPKGPVARDRAARKRKAQAVAAKDRGRVFGRTGGWCFARHVSPVCQGRAVDPHELIPVGAGGPRESWNRVPLCRACHDAGQGRVGGNLLIFDWPGKADGKPPNADEPGNVTVTWRGADHGAGRPDRKAATGPEKGGCKRTAGV